ncbi:MAG: ABC transporter permease [candidate division WOR-3 bacterium]|nr:ABC transporter permease [candidate division WOR-3 bacterium]
MKTKDLISSSFSILKTHTLRSFLTILGIVIGVMTIISILSLIEGMNSSVERQIQSLGSNTIFVQKYQWGQGRMDIQELTRRRDITIEDAWAIAKLPTVAKVAAQKSNELTSLNYQGKTVKNIEVIGSTPDLQDIANYTVETGRFINQEDYLRRQAVCAIGGYVVDNLFPNEEPIGKYLNIRGKRFLVIGVLGRKGTFLGQTQDNIIIIPLTTFEKTFPKPTGYGAVFRSLSIQVLPKSGKVLEQAIDQIRELMRRRRGLGYDKPDDFGINTQESLRQIYKNITNIAYIVMIGVAAISLIVGGIGIMNIMLVAVSERTKEIGLRKAVGANNRDILYQFLFEAVVLSIIGGLIGVILGLSIAKIVSAVSPLPAAAPLWTVLLGISFSAAVGIFFGIYPANRAAQLNPIEALRYE